jgi:NADH-quinone oxidoreductase subunit J
VLAVGVIYAVGSSTMALTSASAPANLVNAGDAGGSVVRLGQLLYSPFDYSYVLPFEIASIVILVAIVGAIVIGRED